MEPCKTCKWWVPTAANPTIGDCRRHSPSMPLLKSEERFFDALKLGVWPLTMDGCGDHELEVQCSP
jgi:hypothetical protein